jgi:hypothetical protein
MYFRDDFVMSRLDIFLISCQRILPFQYHGNREGLLFVGARHLYARWVLRQELSKQIEQAVLFR